MANVTISSVRIAGLTCAVPLKSEACAAYGHAFGEREVEKITKMTGIHARRIADEEVCASDLCVAAAERLIAEVGWERSSIDLLVFVSQTADYLLPATACAIHGRLGLAAGCAAFDVTMGCSGYVYGLLAAAGLVANGGIRRCLLLVGDTISKLVSPEDRSTVLLFGDAGSATALEYDPGAPRIDMVVGSDGRGQNHLIVPAGGFRTRSSPATRARTVREDGSARSDEDLYMNGSELLAFTLACVPRLIRETLEFAHRQIEEIDYFVFHQANRFMIEHFARKSKLPMERVPFNLDRYGNTSSVSIPLLIASELAGAIAERPLTLLVAGFGVGYSVGGGVIEIGQGVPVGLVEI